MPFPIWNQALSIAGQPYVGNEWQQQQSQMGPQQYKPTYGLAAQAAGSPTTMGPPNQPAGQPLAACPAMAEFAVRTSTAIDSTQQGNGAN